MPGKSNLATCIEIAKLTASLGELAPFPYISTISTSVAALLEIIQSAARNCDDMGELGQSIIHTLVVVRDTVLEHEDTGDIHFRDVCIEFQMYLSGILNELSNLKRKSYGVRRFLKAKRVSHVIEAFKQRLESLKGNFLIQVATDSRLFFYDVAKETNASITAIEASLKQMATTIEAGHIQTRGMQEATRVLGALQAQSTERIHADIRTLDARHLYRGMVRDIPPGEIYLSGDFSPSYHWDLAFTEYSTNIEGPKIVRVYQSNNQQAMRVSYVSLIALNNARASQRFRADLNQRLYLRHPNIDQLFGVCTSQHFPALVFHSGNSAAMRVPVDQYIDTLSAQKALLFNSLMYYDIVETTEYLKEFDLWHVFSVLRPGEVANSTLHTYVNEWSRIVLAEFTPRRCRMMLSELHLLLRGKRSQQATQSRILSFDHLKGWDKHHSQRVWSMLKECHFEKDTLPQIYDLIYQLSVDWKLGSGSVPERQCFDPPGSIRQEESVLQNIYHPIIATGYEWSVSRHTGPKEKMIESNSVRYAVPGSFFLSSPSINDASYLESDDVRRMVHSWFAQASQLYHSSDWESSGRIYLQRDLVFHILVTIRDFESWKDCQLSDTFMAEQPTVHISISAPCTDQKTGKIYPPAISFCIDSDPAHLLSLVEVEEMLGVEITLQTWWWECMLPQKQLSTIQEINALCGFDSALRGTDICAYFDLLQLPGKWRTSEA
ncbi:hypothetical protein EDD85DRAFT_934303 [Armillaria nabsnona]|nr:hypothetical protein EDD85DRAFT_934303 [Armillaria nabsnona]